MYSITGITGQVGGAVAQALLGKHLPVRAVVRDAGKGVAWREHGCDVAVASWEDRASLVDAFRGATGVFILPPPVFDPSPDFFEARTLAATLRAVLGEARPERVVYLSTIGAQSHRVNLLTQHTLIEAALRSLDLPINFLRPAWFMENCSWDVAPAVESGVIPSFLQPLDKPVPMVATADIGKYAAELLQESWRGVRVSELEGPHRVTPNEIAEAFGQILGKAVHMQVVPRESWLELFQSQGMQNPLPRARMLDGFNEGWIDFEGDRESARKGATTLEAVLGEMVIRAGVQVR